MLTATHHCRPEYDRPGAQGELCGIELGNGLVARRFITTPAFGTIDYIVNATSRYGGTRVRAVGCIRCLPFSFALLAFVSGVHTHLLPQSDNEHLNPPPPSKPPPLLSSFTIRLYFSHSRQCFEQSCLKQPLRWMDLCTLSEV